jgi:hypothetical protein
VTDMDVTIAVTADRNEPGVGMTMDDLIEAVAILRGFCGAEDHTVVTATVTPEGLLRSVGYRVIKTEPAPVRRPIVDF